MLILRLLLLALYLCGFSMFFGCQDTKITHPVNTNPFSKEKNIYLQSLKICSLEPMTGFYRNGYCESGPDDTGVHSVCAVMTEAFLRYCLENGNDLISPVPERNFTGLKPGDKWCVCADWWNAAHAEGIAPSADLDASHIKTLEYIEKSVLEDNVPVEGIRN